MNPAVIPVVDPIPLPAPVWLLQFLSGLTFVLHLLAMNIALGGGLFALALWWWGRSRDDDRHTKLAGKITTALPVAVAMTITLGIPPLLFLQALYGPLFYTSSILMAWPWISVIGLLLVGYYSYYYLSLNQSRRGGPTLKIGALGVFAFLAIGFLYTSNMTLMSLPEHFLPVRRAWMSGYVPFLSDAMVVPRFLHFVTAAVAVSGLFAMAIGLLERFDARFREFALQAGGFTFVGASVVQFVVGVWFLLTLRRPVLMLFMGQDRIATAIFGIALLLALLAIVFVLVAALGKSPLPMAMAGTGCIVLTIVLMTIMRSIVRDAYLGTKFVVANQPVAPAWEVVAIFLVLLVAGVSVVGWMIHAVVTRRGTATA